MRDERSVKTMERMHGLNWSELVQMEPELGRLLTFARMVGDCCMNWRDVDRGWGQFKDRIADVVGYLGRHRSHPVLGTVGAYDVVYWKLHNAVARDPRGDD